MLCCLCLAADQINDDQCHVYVRGIDEALMLSKIWYNEVLPKWGPEAAGTGKHKDKPSDVSTAVGQLLAHLLGFTAGSCDSGSSHVLGGWSCVREPSLRPEN